LGDLFWSFSFLALQGFGGVLAVVQRELVENKQWLSEQEFVEVWAVAQILPGPNVVNLSLIIGDRYFGIRGAMAAMAGMLCFPAMIVLLIAIAFAGVADLPSVQGALRGMSAVAAGLITATGLKLTRTWKQNVMGIPACVVLAASVFIAVVFLRIRLIGVILVLGGAACVWAYRQLGRLHQS
jgi:chromate transporter